MATQMDYTDIQAPAVAGLQATMIDATIVSRNVQGTGVGFGAAVSQGTNDKACKAFGETDTAVLGITLLDRSAAGDDDTFRVGDSARVITQGDIWVTASVAVDAGDGVYVVPATGAFTNVETANTPITGARWETSAAAGQLAVIRIS